MVKGVGVLRATQEGIALRSVDIRATLHDLGASVTIRQRYDNTSSNALTLK